jgi:hypothetical protein
MLRQEGEEHLIERCRLLDEHRVRGLGNRHQAAARETPDDDFADQRKEALRAFAIDDERRGLHAAERGAGQCGRRWGVQQQGERPCIVPKHLTYGRGLPVEDAGALVVHPLKEW